MLGIFAGCLGLNTEEKSGEGNEVVNEEVEQGVSKQKVETEEERLEREKLEAEKIDKVEKAYEEKDTSICDEISSDNERGSCKYNILAGQAYELKDPSICEEIGHPEFVKNCKENLEY